MNFKCGCSLRGRSVGDGCRICNTELALDMMESPKDVADELACNGLSEDQAAYIASEVYQPLLSIIHTLSQKIDQMAKEI